MPSALGLMNFSQGYWEIIESPSAEDWMCPGQCWLDLLSCEDEVQTPSLSLASITEEIQNITQPTCIGFIDLGVAAP